MAMDLFVAHHNVKSSWQSQQILAMKEGFSSVDIKSPAVNLPDSRRRERDNEGRGMCIAHSSYILLSFIISLRSMGSLRMKIVSDENCFFFYDMLLLTFCSCGFGSVP